MPPLHKLKAVMELQKSTLETHPGAVNHHLSLRLTAPHIPPPPPLQPKTAPLLLQQKIPLLLLNMKAVMELQKSTLGTQPGAVNRHLSLRLTAAPHCFLLPPPPPLQL
uniref:Uncharacterized protein n=1 Tax=Knipowitschia caucasica TaxID=637954 RepID=A0AAV2JZY2_KNICA